MACVRCVSVGVRDGSALTRPLGAREQLAQTRSLPVVTSEPMY
jgi:hypothetical protein